MELQVNNSILTQAYDPTHTTSLRNLFAKDMKRRFEELAKIIKVAIVEQDCFGTKQSGIEVHQMTPPGAGAFSYMRIPQKVEAFMK